MFRKYYSGVWKVETTRENVCNFIFCFILWYNWTWNVCMCTCTSLRTALARASFTLWDLRRPFCTDASSSENTPSVSSSCPSPACLYGSVGTDAQRKQYRSQTRGTEPWRISLPQKCKFCHHLLTLMSLQTHIVNLSNRPKNTFSIQPQQMDSEAFKPQRMQKCSEND